MKTLQESLFDTDLAKQDPVITQWIKDRAKKEKGYLFSQLDLLRDNQDPEMLPGWVWDDYNEHQMTYDWIVDGLCDAFRKQKLCTWFMVSTNAAEAGYEGLYDKNKLDDFNEKCDQFFKKAEKIFELDGQFVLHHGQLPDFFVDYLKEIDSQGYMEFDQRYMQIRDWGILFYDDYGSPCYLFYGCPKGLDPKIKKLLYD